MKITIDAYDGTMHFYVSDPNDPIVRAYAGVFPGLFEPMSAMPADLKAHLRVPEELFNVQTRMFGRYHVTDTQQFFRKDDLWTVPGADERADASRPRPTTWTCGCPDEKGVEFLLLQPMVPISRPNMIAWIAARMDGQQLRSTLVYRFPADTTIFGPAQIEARIDQDPDDQRPDLAVEPVRQQGRARQPDRRAPRGFAHLPPAGLSPVDRVGLPRVQADRRGIPTTGRLERYPWGWP